MSFYQDNWWRSSLLRLRIALCWSMCIAFFAVAHGQTLLEGSVREADSGNPIINANVMATGTGGVIASFVTTDLEGRFSLSIPADKQVKYLVVSHVGHARWQKPINTLGHHHIEVMMIASRDTLPEVSVKARALLAKGDTLLYNVASFTQKGDRTIGDVLARMPGLTVSDNGKVQYLGKDINKFYIDGLDLLGGRYGLATHGVKADDVATVEVMEHHQPMEVLRGIKLEDKAGLNLVMKQSARGSWMIRTLLGGGWSQHPDGMALQIKGVGMDLRKGNQTMASAETNNVGVDLMSSLQDFTTKVWHVNSVSWLNPLMPDIPQVDRVRTLDGRSENVTLSHISRLRSMDLSTQLVYGALRNEDQGSTLTTYYDGAKEKNVVEVMDGRRCKSSIDTRLTAEINRPTIYLNNTFEDKLLWDCTRTDISGWMEVAQQASSPMWKVRNVLKVIHRNTSDAVITGESDTEFSGLRDLLLVDYRQTSIAATERLRNTSFYNEEVIGRSWVLRHLQVTTRVGAQFTADWLHTTLNGMDSLSTSFIHQQGHQMMRLYVEPQLVWQQRFLHMTFNCPLSLLSMHICNEQPESMFRFLPSPSLKMQWQNGGSSATMSGSINREVTSLKRYFPGNIYTDYRNATAGLHTLTTGTSYDIMVVLSTRSISTGIFASLSGWMSCTVSPWMTSRYVNGGKVITTFLRHDNTSMDTNITAKVSRLMSFIHGTLTFDGSLGQQRAIIASVGIPQSYRSANASLGTKIDGSMGIVDWTWQFRWTHSRVESAGEKLYTGYDVTQRGHIDMMLCSNVTLEIGADWYFNQVTFDNHKSLWFIDAAAHWQPSKRWSIKLKTTNLCNIQHYSYRSASTMMTTQTDRWLRGRLLTLSVDISL